MAMTYVTPETIDAKVHCIGRQSVPERQPAPVISLVTTSAAV